MNHITAYNNADTVTYGKATYRVQNDRGHRHIVVYEQGKRRKITVKIIETDCVFNYIFGNGFKDFPCPAMDYWIYRHRIGNRITPAEYKRKFNIA